MTDVLLRHTSDGGDIEYVNGRATLSEGLETAVYLSLFGGNESDSGLEGDDPIEWWGNKTENLESRKLRSETQHLLRSIPLVPANLRRIEDAVISDLGWMTGTDAIATFVGASASIPNRDTVQIDIRIEIDNEQFSFSFTEQTRRQ